jgi:hypothetical protein
VKKFSTKTILTLISAFLLGLIFLGNEGIIPSPFSNLFTLWTTRTGTVIAHSAITTVKPIEKALPTLKQFTSLNRQKCHGLEFPLPTDYEFSEKTIGKTFVCVLQESGTGRSLVYSGEESLDSPIKISFDQFINSFPKRPAFRNRVEYYSSLPLSQLWRMMIDSTRDDVRFFRSHVDNAATALLLTSKVLYLQMNPTDRPCVFEHYLSDSLDVTVCDEKYFVLKKKGETIYRFRSSLPKDLALSFISVALSSHIDSK